MAEPDIVTAPEERFEELRPLWRSLYEHHNELTPQLRDRVRPFKDAWGSRRQLERRWLEAEPSSFVIAALADGRYVGHAFVRVRSGVGFASSWTVSHPLGELATLAVLPEYRGRGIGSALLAEIEKRLGERGIGDMVIPVMSTNSNAARLYERRGAVPYTTELIQRVRPR